LVERTLAFTYNQKLLLLLANQTKLAKIDKRRLRLQGTTQSYDILDGALHRSAKMMMKILDKEDYERNKKGTPAPDVAAEILS
jgi:hypothetical protein